MLTLEGIHFSYGRVRALDGADLRVASDERVALLGASGSGKTTLLRVVAGLLAPDAGTVRWNGADLAGVPPHRRRFGMVFQDFALFPHLDVGQNVAFGLRMQSLPGRQIDGAVAAALRRVGLGGYERRRVSELSGGQAQRVALARTLAPEPRLLLLDEPLGSLDPALRRDLAADLAATLDAAGVPAIVVTHDVTDAFVLGDRIALLDEGRVIRDGTPDRVWAAPGTEAAARLLGLTTIVDVTVGRDGVRPGRHGGRHARAVVRPELVSIAADGTEAGTVLGSVFRGPGFELLIDTQAGTVRVHADSPVAPGQRVQLDIPQEALTLLDG
jgi:thiamine transport system ATP-binding protein